MSFGFDNPDHRYMNPETVGSLKQMDLPWWFTSNWTVECWKFSSLNSFQTQGYIFYTGKYCSDGKIKYREIEDGNKTVWYMKIISKWRGSKTRKGQNICKVAPRTLVETPGKTFQCKIHILASFWDCLSSMYSTCPSIMSTSHFRSTGSSEIEHI